MNCKEESCLCQKACEILGECVMGHDLVKDKYYESSFKEIVLQTKKGNRRFKKICRIFLALRPTSQHKYEKRNIKARKIKDAEILQELGVSPNVEKNIEILKRNLKKIIIVWR